MQWTGTLRKLVCADAPLMGGDFNSPHSAWGCPTDTRRGDAILQALATIKLVLLSFSNSDMPTRIAHYARQSDTTQDLRWASTPLRGAWFALTNSVGRDHLLRTVTLLSLTTQHDKVTIKFTKWDEYRTAFINFDEAPDSSLQIGLGQRFMHNIKSALFEATTTVQVEPVSPPPNLYLLNLWASRLPVLQSYRRSNSAPPHPAQPSHRHCETSHAVFQSRQLACTLLIQREDWPRQDMTYISW